MEVKVTKKDKEPEQAGTLTPNQQPTYQVGGHTTVTPAFLPQPIQAKLTAIGQKFNLPFDLGQADLTGSLPENIKALRTIAEIAEGNAKLLPELLKLARKLMKAEIKEAQYYRAATKAALNHQRKLDKYSADIFLALVRHEAKSARLEYRTNQKADLIRQRAEKKRAYYQDTAFGSELELIDIEIKNLEANNQAAIIGKQQRSTANLESKKRLQEYVDSAFQ